MKVKATKDEWDRQHRRIDMTTMLRDQLDQAKSNPIERKAISHALAALNKCNTVMYKYFTMELDPHQENANPALSLVSNKPK